MLTKNTLILASVSISTLMSGGMAFAETSRTIDQDNAPHYSKEEAQQGLKDAGNAIEKTAKDMSNATKEALRDIKDKAVTPSKESLSISAANDNQTNANALIGKNVYDQQGQEIAEVKDIILDKSGDATMVVLSGGGWLGVGKLAAFDYDIVEKTNENGDIIAPLTMESIEKAAPFSYESSPGDHSAKMLPYNGYSVSELLEGDLMDPNGKIVAEVDNISFRDGRADTLTVGFNRTFGMGGKTTTMDFKELDIVNKDGKAHFKLNRHQAMLFGAYKEIALNQ